MKQINKLGQKITLQLQDASGHQAQPTIHLARLLKTQDLDAWKHEPEKLRDWIADQMQAYFRNLEAVIWVYQAHPVTGQLTPA